MKVLFLTNIPSPYRVDFFCELAKKCELTVVYELENASDRDQGWKSEQERNYKEIYLRSVVKQTSSAWCPSVKRYLKPKEYDIIIVGVYSTLTGMHAIHYMKSKKIPYLINCDGGFISQGENKRKRKLKTYLLSGAVGYLSSGKMADEYLMYYGADKDNIYRYPFSSIHERDILREPISAEEKSSLRDKLNISEEKMILTVGSFIHRKGFDVLLKAMAKLDSKYGVYFIGGEETPEYKELVETNKLTNVYFLPFMNSEKLKEYYYAADLFAFPTREDIWGLVINEAMAAGLPIVTTDNCQAGMELIEGSGKIVPVEDEKQLAEAIEEILKDDSLKNKMAEESLRKIRDYSIENMAMSHMEIFEKVKKS